MGFGLCDNNCDPRPNPDKEMEGTITAYFCHCSPLSRLARLAGKYATTLHPSPAACLTVPVGPRAQQWFPGKATTTDSSSLLREISAPYPPQRFCLPWPGKLRLDPDLKSCFQMTAAMGTLWAPDKYAFLHTTGGNSHFPCWAHFTILFPVTALFISQSGPVAGRPLLRTMSSPPTVSSTCTIPRTPGFISCRMR